MTETEIVRLAQTGDEMAFEHLYKAHYRRIYALCHRMTRNPGLSEDLTQEAFLLAFRKIRSFRSESRFFTWLYRVAVNVVLMNRRKQTYNEGTLERVRGDESYIPHLRTSTRHVSLVDRIALKNGLKQLPRGYKRILLLHDLFGYEHHEIASALRCAHGTSKSQLHKARKRLRTMLRASVAPETI
jgi:RNA polymerase sigma-70 factor (ECF subfamily)